MARANISAMLADKGKAAPDAGETTVDPPEPPQEAVSRPVRRPAPQRPAAGERAADRALAAPAETRATDRKGAVLYADQLIALDIAAKRLNKAKTVRGPRITANTLLRVAADLLLEQGDRLVGNDENEIRKSVGLQVTNLDATAD